MKIGQIEIPNKSIAVAAAGLIMIFLVVYVSRPSKVTVPDTTAAINAALETAKKPLLEQIKAKEAEAKDYKSRLAASETKYSVLVGKYEKLQKEKTDVTPPTTNAELRDRFTALGYPPLPGK
jgi:hypothetical protein